VYGHHRGQAWHEKHWGHLANSGAAALTIEATAVEPRGMITHGCLRLWNDAESRRSPQRRLLIAQGESLGSIR